MAKMVKEKSKIGQNGQKNTAIKTAESAQNWPKLPQKLPRALKKQKEAAKIGQKWPKVQKKQVSSTQLVNYCSSSLVKDSGLSAVVRS